MSDALDVQRLAEAFRARYEQEAPALQRLAEAEIEAGEKTNLTLLRQVASIGLPAVLRRRTRGADKVLAVVARFIQQGAKAILSTGAQRGGDFLNNQLRGRWAEQVVLSMEIDGLVTLPFGPSGAAMPGEEDFAEVVRSFRSIHLLEGKRPDLLAFDRDVWSSLSDDARVAATTWPTRLLEGADSPVVSSALCAIEVKNSTWHYGRRRRAHDRPLAITVKSEELETLARWSTIYSVPVMFVQVLFDEIYCMSFRRMLESANRGHVYAPGDYGNERDRKTGKPTHYFYLTDFTHRCGELDFPDESEAVVQVLDDGAVVPYLVFKPARAHSVDSRVFYEELAYGQ